jgi:hypothetical protein
LVTWTKGRLVPGSLVEGFFVLGTFWRKGILQEQRYTVYILFQNMAHDILREKIPQQQQICFGIQYPSIFLISIWYFVHTASSSSITVYKPLYEEACWTAGSFLSLKFHIVSGVTRAELNRCEESYPYLF